MTVEPAERDDATDDAGPCWCGEANPHFDEGGLDATCGGTGTLNCLCGGDFCVCHNHGSVECDGCEDCHDWDEDGEPFEGLEDGEDLDDYPEHDDETPPEEA